MFRLLYKAISRLQFKKRFLYTIGHVFEIRDFVYIRIFYIKMRYKNIKYNYK